MTTGTEPSELELLRQELQREHEMYLRALADFDNYRRRVERDRASSAQAGKREMLLPLIELVDEFDRALPHMEGVPESVSGGVAAIYRQLLNLLERQGVTPFDTVGQVFDPELHEAVGSSKNEDRAPGTITDEVRRGYRLGEDLLRPARVRVAQ
jgi:molecular chaperone GrpE